MTDERMISPQRSGEGLRPAVPAQRRCLVVSFNERGPPKVHSGAEAVT